MVAEQPVERAEAREEQTAGQRGTRAAATHVSPRPPPGYSKAIKSRAEALSLAVLALDANAGGDDDDGWQAAPPPSEAAATNPFPGAAALLAGLSGDDHAAAANLLRIMALVTRAADTVRHRSLV